LTCRREEDGRCLADRGRTWTSGRKDGASSFEMRRQGIIVVRARVAVWTVARVYKGFPCHLEDLPGCMSRVGKFELSGDLAEGRVPESEHFALFSNLVLLASEFCSAGESSLGAPSTIRRFRREFTLCLSVSAIETFESASSAVAVVAGAASSARFGRHGEGEHMLVPGHVRERRAAPLCSRHCEAKSVVVHQQAQARVVAKVSSRGSTALGKSRR